MYDHIICGPESVHFKLICSCTCTFIWKGDTCTCTSKLSILFFFTLWSIWTLLEHLNIKSLHIHVKYLNMHTRGVRAPVAQLVECPLRETWGHGFTPWKLAEKLGRSSKSFSASFRGVSQQNLPRIIWSEKAYAKSHRVFYAKVHVWEFLFAEWTRKKSFFLGLICIVWQWPLNDLTVDESTLIL